MPDNSSRQSCLIRCASCRFARPNPALSTRCWVAYTCANRDSEFYMAVLNVSPDGEERTRITWTGCELSERR